MFPFLSLLLLLLAPLEGDASPISCYNDQGDAVDWFFLYKLPKQHGGRSPQEGEGLLYLLLQRGAAAWAAGQATMNDSTAAAGRTVGQLYAKGAEPELAYVLYNDQPPEDAGEGRAGDGGSKGGHTKGVVLLDHTRGFWLIHSTPHFPAPRRGGRYFYPPSGVTNGQSFLCVTFPAERFQTVGEQLQINQPHVYDCDVPPALAALVPALAAVCHQRSPPPPPVHAVPHVRPVANRSVTLTSQGGAHFLSFAKGAAFADDLYHSWVAPVLRSDLLVQFWVRSTGVLPSDCSGGWRVLDVAAVQPGPAFRFKTTQDHSKWAVSPAPAAGGGGWVCVGDINRNKAEEKRGGGTLCLRDAAVWKAYRTAAVACQDCGGAATSCPT